MAASVDHVMLKKVENGIFRHNRIFRNNGCINNPWWQSGGIIIFFFKYYIVSSGTQIDAWMCFLNEWNASATCNAPFNASLGAPFCASLFRSWSATLGAIPGVLSGVFVK